MSESIDMSKETTVATVYQLLFSAGGFVALILVSRYLGPESFGVYAALLAVAQVQVSVLAGFGEAIKKRVSEQFARVDQLFSIGLLGVGLYATIVIAFTLGVGQFSTLITPMNSVSISAFIVGSGLFTVVTSFYSGQGNPAASYKFRFLQSLLLVISQSIGIVVGATLNELLILCSISWGVAGVVLLTQIEASLTVPQKTVRRTVYSFARWSIPNQFLTTINERLPYIFLGLVASSTIIGYYEASWKLLVPALLLPHTINNTLSVYISQNSKNTADIRRISKQALGTTTFLVYPILVGGLLFNTPLLTLVYSSDYQSAALILPILSILLLSNGYILIYESIFRGTDAPDIVTKTTILRVILKLLGMAVGFQLLGLYGVFYGMIVADTIICGVYYYLSEISPDALLTGIQLFSAICMGGILHLGLQFVTVTPVATIFGIGSGALLYFTILLILLKFVLPEKYRAVQRLL